MVRIRPAAMREVVNVTANQAGPGQSVIANVHREHGDSNAVQSVIVSMESVHMIQGHWGSTLESDVD